METLAAERETLGDLRHVISSALEGALSLWRSAEAWARTPTRRERLARLYVDAEVFRLLVELGEAAGTPREGPIVKLLYGALWQRVTEFCLELRGLRSLLVDGYAMSQPDTFTSTYATDFSSHELAKAFLSSQALTIAGGTTNINKNIIAERLLALPREPRQQESSSR
jgi:alkylation response protein AidB-like acyl-CoA dehydrogenase